MVMFPTTADNAGVSQVRWGANQSGYVTSGGFHGTSPTTTVNITHLTAWAHDEGRLRGFVETDLRPITYDAGDGSYWLAGRCAVANTTGGWHDVVGTHYTWIKSPTPPPIPTGLVLLGYATVLGGAVTAFVDVAIRRITDFETLTAPRSVASPAVWYVEPGARITPAPGVTFAFSGTIEAGRYQIFDLSLGGTFTFPNGGVVSGEWWGAAGDNVTDSAPALNAAFAAGPANVCVTLGAGIFRIGSTVAASDATVAGVSRGWQFRGVGHGGGSIGGAAATILRRLPAFVGPIMRVQAPLATFSVGWKVQDVQFDGLDRAAGCHGLVVYGGAEFIIRDVAFLHCDRALDLQGAQIASVENLLCMENNYGVILSNENSTCTTVTFYKGRIRNSWVNGITIDGQHSINLVRNVGFYGTVVEAHSVTTGTNAGLYIRKAEQIHLHQCWLEAHSVHVSIESFDDIDHPSRYITFYGCNFGSVSEESVGGRAFNFGGNGGQDGLGCWLESCFMPAGIYEFNQRLPISLRGIALLGTATLAGARWFLDNASLGFFQVIERDFNVPQWGLARYHKPDPTHPINLDERWITATTTTTTPTVLVLFDDEFALQEGGTLYIDSEIVAKRGNNSDVSAWRIAALFTNNAGLVEPQGATTDVFAPINPVPDREVSYDITGDGVRLLIQSEFASVMRWSARIRTTQFQAETP